jgi:hypothetical protein
MTHKHSAPLAPGSEAMCTAVLHAHPFVQDVGEHLTSHSLHQLLTALKGHTCSTAHSQVDDVLAAAVSDEA